LPRNNWKKETTILTFGDENMAVFSVVKLSELDGVKLLAPEFYHPAKILSKRYLEKVGSKRIKDCFYNIREIFDPKKESLSQDGVVFDLSDVTSYFLYGGKNVTSSEEVGSAKKIFRKNDVLISRLRPYLKEVSFIGFNGKLKLGSTEFIVLRQKNKNYYPEVLFAFLISRDVQNILAWSITGTEHPRFNEDYFLKLPFPDFSEEVQKKIRTIVQSAWKIFLNSLELYSQAENLLLEELGLKDFNPKYEKTYTANLSDALSAHRIDAEYFQPAYEEVIEKLKGKNIELKSLRKFILRIQKGIEPGGEKYQNVGKPFIRVSNLSIYGFIDRDQKYLSEEIYQDLKENYEPKQGDVLLTKDATPGIAYVVKEEVEGIISSGIVKLQVNDREINKEYLALCINSFIGKMQAERDCVGSIIFHWKPEQIKQIKIPLLPLSTQQKIVSLIQKSHEARKKAKELLNVAKKTVEIAIKKNEEEALDYISKSIKKS